MLKTTVNLLKSFYYRFLSNKSKREKHLLSQYHRALALPNWGLKICKSPNHDLANRIDITVIITCFNYSTYIQEALKSVFLASQYKTEIEVIVIDDASKDKSNQKIRELIKESPIPMTLLCPWWNVGVSRARNLGIIHARGDYIFILDADNAVYPRALLNLFCRINELSADAAFGPIDRINPDGSFHSIVSHKEFEPDYLFNYGNYIDAMALFRKEKLLQIGGYDVSLLKNIGGWEDYSVWLKFANLGYKVAFSPQKVGFYRIKSGSMASEITNEEVIAFRENMSFHYPEFKAFRDLI